MTSGRKRRRAKDRADVVATKLRKKSSSQTDLAPAVPLGEAEAPPAVTVVGRSHSNSDRYSENDIRADTLEPTHANVVDPTPTPSSGKQPLALGLDAYDSEDD
jgi:hypothetical protein